MDSWPTGRLLSTAARLVEHAWSEALEARGLTHAGLIVLHFLDRGPLGQSEIAARARVENQTMSRTIDRLERAGLVSREVDDRDRRRFIVSRTSAGDDMWKSTRTLESEIFPGMNDERQLRQRLLEIIGKASEDRW